MFLAVEGRGMEVGSAGYVVVYGAANCVARGFGRGPNKKRIG